MKYLMITLLAAVLAGCDKLTDPPLTVTWRGGVLSDHVLQVCNLSAAEGIEIYVYVCNSSSSVRSGNVVVPANSSREFGKLELQWDFKPGDKGFVSAVKYPRKLCFTLNADKTYRTWFSLDDIPEIDVAAQVRARKEAEFAARVELMGRELFVGIMQANTERAGVGLPPVWPNNGTYGLKDRKPRGWTEKILAKIGKKPVAEKSAWGGGELDICEIRMSSSTDYFNELFDVSNIGTGKHRPYVDTDIRVLLIGNADQCVKGGKILPEGVLWSVIADYDDVDHGDNSEEVSDNVPVLVSANFPCERLCSSWDGNTKASEVIPLLENHQFCVEMQHGFVVVYANGKGKWIPSSRATLREIYGNAFTTCKSGRNCASRYLTPTGIVVAFGFSGKVN